MMAIEHICTEETCTLRPEVRDQINRVALLRSNAAGARHMAERFDEAADAINAEIEAGA